MADLEDRKEDISHLEQLDSEPHGVDHLRKEQYINAREAAISETRSPWTVLKENTRVMMTILSVQTQGIILGLEYVLLGALVGNQAFCRTMGAYDAASGRYSVDAWKLSLWAGVFGIMQFAGQATFAFICDRFGRRAGLYLVILVTYIGVALEVASPNYKVYTVAKVVMGTATGGLQVAIPTYVAEVAPREIRGISIGLFAFEREWTIVIGRLPLIDQSTVSFGALMGNLVTYAGNQAFPSATDNRGWRVPLYVGLAAPTVSLILEILTLAESPYWLTLKGRRDDAVRSIRRLYPRKTEAEVEQEANLLVYTIEKEREMQSQSSSASFLDCLRGVNLRRTFVAAFPSLAQQICGNQLVQSYSTYFFGLANITDSLRASCIVSALGLIGAIGAFFLVEKKVVGRFWLVFLGIVAVTICMLGIGVVDTASGGTISSGGGWALVIFVGLYNLAVSVGPGVAGWAYAGEAGSVRLRAKTSAFATGSNAIVGTFWNVVLPYELTAIGPKTGYMFFGFGVLCSVVIWFGIPDLTGRTYAEMDELFEKKTPARKFRTTVCTGDYGTTE